MRGATTEQPILFSYVDIEERIPADHPLRAMRALVDPVLTELSPRFGALYPAHGRPSIPPEQLLRALLLQILYSVRSERLLMEELNYNLLFRWFVGLGMDGVVWHPTVFSKNRERLLAGEIAEAFLTGVLQMASSRGLLSDEHYTVDGTLLEAWASQKSFQPKTAPPRDGNDRDGDPGNPTVNFHGQRRSNATHASTTDPDARLARKGLGKEAKLAYQASVVIENRHGLVVTSAVGHATGTAECDQALAMLALLPARGKRPTIGGDKGYDIQRFVAGVRALGITPHVAQRTVYTSAIDGRTTRHPGYATSQRQRKQVEESFGWGKVVGLLRRLRHRGLKLVRWIFTFTNAAYNLVRLRTLQRVGVCG